MIRYCNEIPRLAGVGFFLSFRGAESAVGIRKYQKGERIAAAGVARLAMTVEISRHSEETDCRGTCGASQ